jgi:hypothetical protein
MLSLIKKIKNRHNKKRSNEISTRTRLSKSFGGNEGVVCFMFSFRGMSTTTLHSEPSTSNIIPDLHENDYSSVIDIDTGKLISTESCNDEVQTKCTCGKFKDYEWRSSSVDPSKETRALKRNPREFLRNRVKRKNSKLVMNRIDQAGRFGCNSVLINGEREKVGVRPLARDHVLHAIAIAHAEDMAKHDSLHHSSASQTMFNVVKQSGSCRIIGENITVTKSGKRDAHALLFASEADQHNMLNEAFKHIGVGTCESSTGKLYMCQVYKG